MRRKAVTRCLDTIRKLRATIRFSGEDLVHRLARRSAASVRESFIYRPVLEHWDAELATVESALSLAEDAYVRDKARLADLRRQRNKAALALREEYNRLHRLLRAVVDLEDLTCADIMTPPPVSATMLPRHVDCAAHLIRDLDREGHWPLSRIGLPAALVAESLAAGASELTDANRALDEAAVDVDLSHSQADDATDAAARVAPWIAKALDSLCRLAGR